MDIRLLQQFTQFELGVTLEPITVRKGVPAPAIVRGKIVYEAARGAKLAVLNCIRAAATVVNLETLQGVIELHVYVNALPDFQSITQVADVASNAIFRLFGEVMGQHVRTEIGCKVPGDMLVMASMTFNTE